MFYKSAKISVIDRSITVYQYSLIMDDQNLNKYPTAE